MFECSFFVRLAVEPPSFWLTLRRPHAWHQVADFVNPQHAEISDGCREPGKLACAIPHGDNASDRIHILVAKVDVTLTRRKTVTRENVTDVAGRVGPIGVLIVPQWFSIRLLKTSQVQFERDGISRFPRLAIGIGSGRTS